MLTADLVRARVRDGELCVTVMDKKARVRATALAEAVLGAVRSHVGATQAELEAALRAIPSENRDVKLKAGLAKLVLDRTVVEGGDVSGAPELRAALFTRAAEARRGLAVGERFDRDAVVAAVAAERGLDPADLERMLYADLRAAQIVREAPAITAAELVDGYPTAEAQAVLLRATRVTVDVVPGSAGAARSLFRALKWNRLLFTLARTEAGYRVVLDGPLSLFDSVTKYGLQLALALPAFEGCASYSLRAELRWGKDRRPLVFRAEGGHGRAGPRAGLVDEARDLADAVKRADLGWRVRAATEVLDLPGVGVCVPDLVLERGGEVAFVEVMGFWSRDAVWRRVELVQQGLAAPVVFCVSSRLRVSEAALGDDAPAALYVYKGTMNARAVIAKAELIARPWRAPSSKAPKGGRSRSARRAP